MDRLASYIARNDPNVKAGDSTDNIVVLEKEKSVSNQNEKATHLVFSHKPAAEVFKNPDLLASAKLARIEIKKQLVASGRATNNKAEKILDNIKYNSVILDRKGYGKDVEKVMGSSSFHLMTQALKIDTEKIRFDDTTKTLNAGASKSRAKRGTGVFQPPTIQTGRSTDSQQKKSTLANTKQPLIEEESSLSEDDFIFPPSRLIQEGHYRILHPIKINLAAALPAVDGAPPNLQRLALSNRLRHNHCQVAHRMKRKVKALTC